MNIRTVIILIITILILAPYSTVEASGDLWVDFGLKHRGDPLFHIKNMSPGNTISERIVIHNDTNTNQLVGVRTIIRKETGNFSKALNIIITNNGQDIYGKKTLKQFFSESSGVDGMTLATIPPRENKSYIFTVQFPPSAGNEFQSKQLVFDLQISNKTVKSINKENIWKHLYRGRR